VQFVIESIGQSSIHAIEEGHKDMSTPLSALGSPGAHSGKGLWFPKPGPVPPHLASSKVAKKPCVCRQTQSFLATLLLGRWSGADKMPDVRQAPTCPMGHGLFAVQTEAASG